MLNLHFIMRTMFRRENGSQKLVIKGESDCFTKAVKKGCARVST